MNCSLIRLRTPTDQSEVPFFNLMRSDGLGQVFVSFAMNRKNEDTRSISVEALSHADFRRILRAEGVGQVSKKGLIQGAFIARGSGLGFDSGRLINYNDIGVLINDVFGGQREDIEWTPIHINFDLLTCLDWVRTFSKAPACDVNATNIDNFTNFGPGKGIIHGRNKLIDALTPVFFQGNKSKNHNQPAPREKSFFKA